MGDTAQMWCREDCRAILAASGDGKGLPGLDIDDGRMGGGLLGHREGHDGLQTRATDLL